MYGYINNNKRNLEIIQESRRSCSVFRSRSLFSLKQQKSSIARLRLQGVEETLLCLLKIPTQLYTCGWFNGSTSSTLWFIIRGLFAFFSLSSSVCNWLYILLCLCSLTFCAWQIYGARIVFSCLTFNSSYANTPFVLEVEEEMEIFPRKFFSWIKI